MTATKPAPIAPGPVRAAPRIVALDRPIARDRRRTESPVERHGYRSPRSSRYVGSIGAIAVCALIAAGLLVTLDHVDRPKVVAPPVTLTLLTVASPPTPMPRTVEKPRQVRKQQVRPAPREVAPVQPPLVPLPSPQVRAVGPPKAAVEAPPQAKAAPTPTPPAPPIPAAQPPSHHGPDQWEGRVLARLERYRRYPSDAQRARAQGTATVRFRIDRNGHVLSAALETSSGSAELDAAAMDTLRRADPLPKIPADRPDEIELVVPIEFFIRDN